jgi:hypothetical protein
MAKYRFVCDKCSLQKTQFTSHKVEEISCECGAVMKRQVPVIAGQEVRETVDTLTNTKWKQDQKEILQKRKEDHFWTVEVPRLVQTYSLKTCLEEGWLKYNEKGELVIGKAPNKT